MKWSPQLIIICCHTKYYNIVDYIAYAVRYIPVCYLFNIWKVVPFNWPYLPYLFSPTLLNQTKPNKNIMLPQRMVCSSLMSPWLSSLCLCVYSAFCQGIWGSRLDWGEFGDSQRQWWTQPVREPTGQSDL